MMKTMRREDVMISSSSDIELVIGHLWTDKIIAKIANEQLAKEAFEKSLQLQFEFYRPGTFVAYWKALRKGQIKNFRPV